MDAVTEAVSPAEVRPTPPPALAMDASGLPSDYAEWQQGTRNDYLRSTISAYDQQRLFGTIGFVFKDPAAKYEDELKTLKGWLYNETTRIEEPERDRKQDLARYMRRESYVKDAREELDMQRQLTQAYFNELDAVRNELDKNPIVKGLRVYAKTRAGCTSRQKQRACLLGGRHRGRTEEGRV